MPIDIADFLGGAPRPRRPGGLPTPHPASGEAPDLMQILAEAATLNPPHPGQLNAGQQGRLEDIVNNPSEDNIPQEAFTKVLSYFLANHGVSGTMPGVRRALLDELANAQMGRIDKYAQGNPTLARMILQGGGQEPNLDALTALSDPKPPRLSEFFRGMTPTSNPAEMSDKLDELYKLVYQLQPQAEAGRSDSRLSTLAKDSNIGPEQDKMVNAAPDDGLDPLLTPMGNLSTLIGLGDTTGEAAQTHDLADIISEVQANPAEAARMIQALTNAIRTSNVGSGWKLPGLDPSASRSLAPDFNPSQLGPAVGASPDSANPDFMMQMLGLTRTLPQRGAS